MSESAVVAPVLLFLALMGGLVVLWLVLRMWEELGMARQMLKQLAEVENLMDNGACAYCRKKVAGGRREAHGRLCAWRRAGEYADKFREEL